MTASAFTSDWLAKPMRLRCSASYVRLFEIHFKALEDTRPFNLDRAPVTTLDPPFDAVPPEYDVVVLRHQVLENKIPVLRWQNGMLRYAPNQFTHFFTDLRGGADAAFRGMSSKTRSTLARKVRKFADFSGGQIDWRVYQTPDDMETFHGIAREVARKTYQERLFDSGLPESEAFRREMLDLASRDQVRGFVLFHSERPVAYLYTPAPEGLLVYDYLGYDPEFARWSPGSVLQYLALEQICAEQKFPLYCWGFGYSQTKEIFSTRQLLAADVYYFRPTVRNLTAVTLHHAVERTSATVGSILDRLNLKRTIKRWLKRL